MQITTETTSVNGFTVINVKGKLDVTSSEGFTELSISETEKNPKIVLDFAGLEYISSAGLRAVLMIAKKAAAAGGSFAVAGAVGSVVDVFKISGFDGIIRMCPTIQEITG